MTRKANGSRQAAEGDLVLVAGATGFLGKHLTLALMERKVRVRALVRQPTLVLERLGVEVIAGDICDPVVCAEAVRGVRDIYHAAGLVSRDPDDAPHMYRVHVDGTRALLKAAAAAGARRVVVVSTSGTVAVSDEADRAANEESPYQHTLVARWPYYLSKIYQEQTALEIGRLGEIEVVVVGPSLLLGPGDERGSSTGDVEKVVRGFLPLVPKGGGVAFVDARDAAAACILAMERGRPGERYLISAANVPLETFLGRVARLAGKPAPRAVEAPTAMLAAGRLVEGLFRALKARPPIEAISLEMAQHCWYVDSSKAARELGFAPRDPQVTLTDTVRDIERRHNLRPGSPQAADAY